MFIPRGNLLIFFILFNANIEIKCEFNLTILHTNDLHARIQEVSRTLGVCKSPSVCYGGFGRVAYEAKRIKSNTPNAIFLHAGDSFEGSYLFTIFKWRIIQPLLQMFGIDVMTLGNHEFDNGVEGLTPFLQATRIPVVTCNLNTTNEPSLVNHTTLKPWHMLQVENVKIAIIGYLTPDTKFLSSPGNVTFLDEISMIKKYVKEVKNIGANLIFALGHSGFLKDQQIAKEIPEVDLVVGGHSHTFTYTGTPPDIDKPEAVYPLLVVQDSGKKVPIVQAFHATKYLGKLNLVWDNKFNLISATGNPILLNSMIAKDPSVEEEITKWISKLNSSIFERVGATKVYLDGMCKLKECNLGNFATDAFIDYVAKQSDSGIEHWRDAAICILNGGSIRSSIDPTDKITKADLITVLPFNDQLVRLTMKGSTLLKALNYNIEGYEATCNFRGNGKFLQFSGLKVEYIKNENCSLTLKSALARCATCGAPTYEEINEDEEYSIVTISYLFEGGDNYIMFRDEATNLQTYDDAIVEILTKYLRQMSPIHPEEKGRIIFTD